MNTRYVYLLKCCVFYELFLSLVAISDVTNNIQTYESHTRRLHSKERSYLYLNYKEAYGLRFVPKNVHRKRVSNDSSDAATTLASEPTTGYDATTVSESSSTESTITIASPSSSEVAITTMSSSDNMASTTESKRQPILAFASLLSRVDGTKPHNETTTKLSSSSLKDTLMLIRKRLKQWFSFGLDPKASLVNGQRFLNVFNVIKFDNGPCTSTQEGLAEMSGVCYHDYQCTQLGGSAIDECADGLGVCCICKTFHSVIFLFN